MHPRCLFGALLAGLSVLAGGPAAMAGTVTAVLNSVAPSGTLHYSLDGGSTFQETLAGKINAVIGKG